MFANATAFNQDIGVWNFSNVLNISNILDNSGLTTKTYNTILNSFALSTTLPKGLNFGGSGLVYSPDGKISHDYLSSSIGKALIFDGDSFISSNIIQKNVPFDFTVNAGTSFSTGNYTFPANQIPGYPEQQIYSLSQVPGIIPYKNLIFKISGNILPVLLKNTNNLSITYYLTVVN